MTTLVKSIHPQFIYHLRSSFLATLRWWPIFFTSHCVAVAAYE